jgi:hypothetical protein
VQHNKISIKVLPFEKGCGGAAAAVAPAIESGVTAYAASHYLQNHPLFQDWSN